VWIEMKDAWGGKEITSVDRYSARWYGEKKCVE
jgi:hypothetical protein